MYKILIVEDDEVIRKQMEKHLKKWEYEVVSVEDFESVFTVFTKSKPHLVLMDITLPYFNGYHWCNKIREISEVPIIFISAAGEDLNILMGMQMGGDDYIVKPFSLDVLLAKIRAVLRRSYENTMDQSYLMWNEVYLSLDQMTVRQGDKEVELSKNEFKILETLMRQSGTVISRGMLMEKLWQSDLYIDDNTLTVNIARLRKRLEEIDLKDFIQTKKGVGYYVPDEKA
ncbi:MAG: response regulator transcription factor [Tissierellia bacterium]|nr:response regulator transcription factor [Tissierellia bacterium]